MFICESPARKLRRELGSVEQRSRVCAGDWFGLSTGDRVHTIDDPRHVGRVNAWWDMTVLVQWEDNGWKEEVHRDMLVKVVG